MARQKQPRKAKRPAAPARKLEGVAIVLLGSLNPMIFQPAWMAAQGILDHEDVETAEVAIIHPDVCSFKAGAIGIEVTRERFQVETTDETAVERLRDLVTGVFGRLAHTPITAFGINRNAHYQMPTQSKWHALGHLLVPKESWEPILRKPGTRSLTVEGVRPDGRAGWIRVQFEPSVRVTPNGVYVAVNDHVQLATEPSNATPASDAMTVLSELWDESIARARDITSHVISLV